MKKTILSMLILPALLCSCGGRADKQAEAAANDTLVENIADMSVVGRWHVENIVVNDTLSLRPAEITSNEKQGITFFADSTFGVVTNCNSMGGGYVVNGDSISFTNMFATQMACEDMRMEQLLGLVLQGTLGVDFESDSVLRLNAVTPGQYVLLHKAAVAE
ncbi:META domain-containing protein [Muribaculum sp.]|jgi:heat shock protein HslJ|uniref:META domain-containing protein n=2 Tax=Muribaculum TaxID=1918540 RepID=UPI00257C2254|nr:META domain-containing protein [Muribaculum sp.]